MRPAFYQEQWDRQKQAPEASALESLSQRIASSFIDRYFYSDEYNSGYIHLLCDMATHFSDPALNQIASRALFGIVIERLCDDFEELQTASYNRLICQVVDFLRKLPEGEALDVQLNGFGLSSEQQLYQRIESIRLSPDKKIADNLQLKKVLILSRVTIGADVAITSVICQRVSRLFPDARVAVIGNSKLHEIFAVESGFKVHELQYARRGGLLERFLVWLDLLQEVRAELEGLAATEYLVLDPDSRLTQLGVLPLVPLENYRFFNSRGKADYPVKGSISELTNLWLDNIFGQDQFCYPKVWPGASALSTATQLAARLQGAAGRNLITLNLGVGGNARKRIAGKFESEMVLALLQEPPSCVILDLGFGDEERQRSEAILKLARERGHKTQKLRFSELQQVRADCQLLAVECSVAEIAAVIASSDEFIGYDSACQHIAAAEGIKTYTVFAGTNNVRFIRRWHACGPGTSEIIYVDTISRDGAIDNGEIIARLMDLRQA